MGLTLLLLLALVQEPASITRQVFEVAGKVDSVNRAGRTITVTAAGALLAPIYVGPDLAIFDTLNKGDELIVRYYDWYSCRGDARQANGSAAIHDRRRAG